mmetsp:Transcript_120582/g.257520  ORF Transcript_120582/g.257520 Transcript_120582/m.257520 type:complete len:247 (-) Transcript_120582:51-791(-)
MLQSAHLVDDTTVRPNVATVVVGLLVAQLRRQVVGGAYQGVGEVRALTKNTSHTEISEPGIVCRGEEDVQCLYIAVKDTICMEVLQAEADLEEKSPDRLFLEALLVPLQVHAQVTVLTILHDDVEGLFLQEGLHVGNNEFASGSHLAQQRDLLVRILPCLALHTPERNLLADKGKLVRFSLHLMHDAETATPELLPKVVVAPRRRHGGNAKHFKECGGDLSHGPASPRQTPPVTAASLRGAGSEIG